MGVPILRLPVVALKVLVDHFNDVELVIVSSLSKRADWFPKACGKKNVSFFNLSDSEIRRLRNFVILELFLLESRRQKELPEWNFKLRCSVSNGLDISISCEHFTVSIHFEALENIERFEGARRNLKIGDSFVPVVTTGENDGGEEFHTFWNTSTYGMIVFMDYFKNNFNLSIEQLNFATNRSRAIRTIVTHINSTQTVVKNVLVGCSPPISEDDFKFVLENVSATDYFVSGLTLSQNFKFNGTIRSKIIDIMNARWFTIQNVLESVESQEIHVYGANYTKEELRTFLEEWKAGKLPKLKELTLGTKEPPLYVIEGYERWEGRCNQCESERSYSTKIKGHDGCHGCVYTEDRKGYFMSIHGN
ncbi:hypothetical protein CAEBREN_15949 [Caenorhabditis brenneri]|uniref:Sdz-33 F-box domain-containing protein n=1 Tax=Caenorhabditis brenneri TaxID=135651 RepID=G0NSK7_CAEBE|nr:hypothetical protein CAEBREN_15949 [Caenorhabditis brenneri]